MYNINGFVLQEIGKVVEVVKRKNLSGSYISIGVWYSIATWWIRFHNQIIKVNFPSVIELKHKSPC